MSSLTASPSFLGSYQSLRRFSVAEYHRMIQTGILDEDDPVELLEGYVVLKMPRNPPHDGTIQVVGKRLGRLLPAGWDIRIQSAVTLADSEPEPDLVVARGDERTYLHRHPGAADIGLVVEVADSTLARDRVDKVRIYARASLSVYWIVNLVNGQIEELTSPSGATSTPGYARQQIYPLGSNIPLILDGVTLAMIPVADLLP